MKTKLILIFLMVSIALSCTKKTDPPKPTTDYRDGFCGTYTITDSTLIQYTQSKPPVSNPDQLTVNTEVLVISKDPDHSDALFFVKKGVNSSIYFKGMQVFQYNGGIAFNIPNTTLDDGSTWEGRSSWSINGLNYDGFIWQNGTSIIFRTQGLLPVISNGVKYLIPYVSKVAGSK
jgi:hypothetical protein